MKHVTDNELELNFNKLIKVIEDNFKDTVENGNRKTKLLKLYNDLAERIAITPASSIDFYHSCYPGGLVVHTLNVIDYSIIEYKKWKHLGSKCEGYTLENLIFSALNHDLGKVGNLFFDFYTPNDNAWAIKNQGKNYTTDPKLQQMDHAWRSLFLLNQYEIKVEEQEFLGIMIHDGAFKESNASYFINFDKNKLPKTNLPFILFIADLTAYRIEIEKEGTV